MIQIMKVITHKKLHAIISTCISKVIYVHQFARAIQLPYLKMEVITPQTILNLNFQTQMILNLGQIQTLMRILMIAVYTINSKKYKSFI